MRRRTHKRSGFSTIRLLDWVPDFQTNRLELSTETRLPSQHKANPFNSSGFDPWRQASAIYRWIYSGKLIWNSYIHWSIDMDWVPPHYVVYHLFDFRSPITWQGKLSESESPNGSLFTVQANFFQGSFPQGMNWQIKLLIQKRINASSMFFWYK